MESTILGNFMKNVNKDLVVALISGRLRNRNMSISDILESNKKVTVDQVMVGEGLRPRPLMIDRKCFRNNPEEKQLLKEIKADWKKKNSNHKHKVIVPFNAIG